MTTLINFPTDSTVSVQTFASASDAEALAATLSGPTFVLGKVDAKALRVLTTGMLVTIYNAANPSEEPVKRLGGSKAKIIERVQPLISGLAVPGEAPTPSEEDTMATRKSSKKSKKADAAAATEPAAEKPAKKGKKGAAKKATAAAEKGAPGRTSDFAGKKLYKTEKGATRMQEKGRRFASFSAITNGMLYETALEKGAHKDDITNMVRNGRLEVRD